MSTPTTNYSLRKPDPDDEFPMSQQDIADAFDTIDETLADIAGGEADHPDLATHDALGLATDAELTTHAADTTSVHGITDTSALETTTGAQTKVDTHSADTTSVHGIADTSALETTTGAQTKVDTHAGLADPHTGYVLESLFDANTILAANSDNTPAALTVAEQRLVGRITGGSIDDLTADQARTLLGVSQRSIGVPLIGYYASVGTWQAVLASNITVLQNNPLNQNDYLTWQITLPAGTYTLRVLHRTEPSGGIMTFNFNGSAIATVDNYAAANTVTYTEVTGIVIAATATADLQMIMATKHASSTSYGAKLAQVAFARTA